jgi:hypothetical protein
MAENRQRDLLAHSTRVCNIAPWLLHDQSEYPGLSDNAYTWLNESEILYFRRSSKSSCGAVYKRNTFSGADICLDGVTAKWQKHYGVPERAEVSPDGNWLMSGDGDNPLLSTIDGLRGQRLAQTGDSYWLNDSRSIITCVTGITATRVSKVYVRSVDSPNHLRLLSAVKPFPSSSTPLTTSSNYLLTTSFGIDYNPGDDVGVYDVDIMGSGSLRKTLVHLPNYCVQEIRFSRDGKHILWMVQDLNESAPDRLLHALMRWVGLPHSKYSTTRLLVSNLDGTAIKELGKLGCKSGEISHISWQPDGRNVSFIYKGELFTTTVEM